MATMSKPVVAVDIDDVLVPHFVPLIAWYNQEYGTKLTAADHSPVGTPEELQAWKAASYQQAVRQVHRFFDTSTFLQAEPLPGAAEVLQRLRERYELVVVTSRDTIIETQTRDWLEKYFAGLFADVHFTARYSLEGKSRSKIEVCQSVAAAYLIDDILSSTLQAAEAGMAGVLFGRYAWNRTDQLPRGITRCQDWRAVEEYFHGRG